MRDTDRLASCAVTQLTASELEKIRSKAALKGQVKGEEEAEEPVAVSDKAGRGLESRTLQESEDEKEDKDFGQNRVEIELLFAFWSGSGDCSKGARVAHASSLAGARAGGSS